MLSESAGPVQRAGHTRRRVRRSAGVLWATRSALSRLYWVAPEVIGFGPVTVTRIAFGALAR
jgi:hypothetical protein